MSGDLLSKLEALERKIDEIRGEYLEAIALNCAECMGYSRMTKGAIREIKNCCLGECHMSKFRLEAIDEYTAGD